MSNVTARSETEGRGDVEAAAKLLQPAALSEPEPDQRGRKRRRSPMPFSFVATAQTPSGESSTFRGRGRQRSSSLANLASRNASRSVRDPSFSPSPKRLLRYAQLEQRRPRRRNQSPSRPPSPDDVRRRHRTRSRSRNHGEAAAAAGDLKSPLRHGIAAEPRQPEDGDEADG